MRGVRYLCVLLLLLVTAGVVNATHNRAGYITYRHLGGLQYEITVITYTKLSAPADREFLPIDWGDGSPPDSLEREFTVDMPPPVDIRRNVYIKTHVFPSAGSYLMCISDPNRNAGVLNIDGSVNRIFGIHTRLLIGPQAGNNSVEVTAPPIQDGCIQQPWVFNPGAFDEDGDSLSYELTTCLAENCEPFNEEIYSFPNEIQPGPDNNISINPITGTITWDSPQTAGEYNLAFIIREWRNGQQVGFVLVDMQITIRQCTNQPPELADIPDTCVEAGTNLQMDLFATDPNSDDNIEFDGYGGPFVQDVNPASIEQPSPSNPLSGTFRWNTECEHVRLAPYQTTIVATDDDAAVEAADYGTFNVTVVGPPVTGVGVTAQGSDFVVDWNPYLCSNASCFQIYRREGPYGFEPDHCETGVPEYTGYEQIATVDASTFTYTDSTDLDFGRPYCYIIVACFPDGAESYASDEACASLDRVIPVITKVSIGETDTENGRDTLRWENPTEIDTTDQVLPPYRYQVFRGEGFTDPDELVYETGESQTLAGLERELISSDLNTEDTSLTYRVELVSSSVGNIESNNASSVFLEIEPGDNQLFLNFEQDTPWQNYRYYVYRQNELGDFELIGQTDSTTFVDTALVNNETYCYYAVSEGSYYTEGLPDPLYNTSQEECGVPYDLTPPCPPELSIDEDCEFLEADLNWTNPNEECAETDDVLDYNIYYARNRDSEFELIGTIAGAGNTEFFYEDSISIAGCYAITALDSLSERPNGDMVRNESEFSNVVCIDNCPRYEFPNVFTPNADGRNDVFRPYINRSVDRVEFKVFNRWGKIIFETDDPDVAWDGNSNITGELVPDGTYYYTCRAYAITLNGIEPIDIAGYVSVFTSESPIRSN